MDEIINYTLPILGVIIGASLQFFFSKISENKKQQKLLKNNAYADFLSAVAGIAISQKYNNKDKEIEYTILLANSKSKIAVYGSDKVISKIAEFWRIGPNLINPLSLTAFTLLVLEMRNDNHKSDNIKFNDISQLLIGKDIE